MAPDLVRLRWVGIAEGISYLMLLGIAMPLKYLAGWPLGVEVIGLLHGLLFISFGLVALCVTMSRRLPFIRLIEAGVAALLPFGPFVWDRWALPKWAGSVTSQPTQTTRADAHTRSETPSGRTG